MSISLLSMHTRKGLPSASELFLSRLIDSPVFVSPYICAVVICFFIILFYGNFYFFIIHEDIVKGKVFSVKEAKYIKCPLLTGYYIDSDTLSKGCCSFLWDKKFKKNSVVKQISKELALAKDFIFHLPGVPDRMVGLISIRNYSNEHAGYMVNIYEDSAFRELKAESFIYRLLITALFLALCLFNVYYLWSRRRFEHFAVSDHLSGLYTRHMFMEILTAVANKSNRDATVNSLILFDIDDFKMINDRFGHPAGDKVIKSIAHLSKEVLRESDVISRWGGEEFIVLLTNTGLEQASRIAEKIRRDNNGSLIIEKTGVSCSFGVTEIEPANKLTIDEHVKELDGYLYKAKETGKNRVCYSLNC